MGVNDHFDKLWDRPPEGSPPREVRVLIGNLMTLCGEERPEMPAIIRALEQIRAMPHFAAQQRPFHQCIGDEALAVCRGWDEPHLYKWARDTLASALKVMYPGEEIDLPDEDGMTQRTLRELEDGRQ